MGQSHPEVTDQERLLVQAAQADPREFAALYDFYLVRVYRYVATRVCDAAVAQDLTSQIFLNALENLPRYKPDAPFAAWLFAIAHNMLVSHFRRQRPVVSYDALTEMLPAEGGDPSGPVEQAEQTARLCLLLGQLGEADRDLLRLRFAAGLTYREIGAVLGRSEGAVKMAAHRLLRKLQREMGGGQ